MCQRRYSVEVRTSRILAPARQGGFHIYGGKAEEPFQKVEHGIRNFFFKIGFLKVSVSELDHQSIKKLFLFFSFSLVGGLHTEFLELVKYCIEMG